MERRMLHLCMLPLLLVLQDCGGDDNPPTSVATTPTTTVTTLAARAPGCTITASPVLAKCNQETELTITITGGPADGSFSTPSGSCGGFRNITEAKCKMRMCNVGKATMTFLVSNANGGSSCFVEAYGAHAIYGIINFGPAAKYSDGNGSCVWVERNASVDPDYADGFPVITLWGSLPSTPCSGSKRPEGYRLDFDGAVSLDSPLNGGNFDGRVAMNPKRDI